MASIEQKWGFGEKRELEGVGGSSDSHPEGESKQFFFYSSVVSNRDQDVPIIVRFCFPEDGAERAGSLI